MASNKTDFLRFSAYSIKDLITRKLSEDTKYTDLIYEGSNITILIDLVSYMYQCLMYQLNNAASETMFVDTQIYENINRLINLIGYHPKGITPSYAQFYLDNENLSFTGTFIPKYAYIDTGLTDSRGEKICYSVTEKSGFNVTTDSILDFNLTNGKWKMYSTVFTASGSQYELFKTSIGSNILNGLFCANNMIDVYVLGKDTGTYRLWKRSDYELLINSSSNSIDFSNIYDNNAEVFTLLLDNDKNYVIKFGNGLVGKMLNKGDLVYIFYLDTNGLDGSINTDTVGLLVQMNCSKDDFGLTTELFKELVMEGIEPSLDKPLSNIMLTLNTQSSTAKREEQVDDIRKNAPSWFKMGQRLVTASDYEYYMKNIALNTLVDCTIQNNWEYCSTFYKWLYELGQNGYNVLNGLRKTNGHYYISENKFAKHGYKYSDPADGNNVYIWTKLENGDIESLRYLILDDIERLKMITLEVVLLNPISVKFAITAAPLERVIEYITQGTEFDVLGESYIEITLNANSLYSADTIQNKILDIFIDYFSPKNNTFGKTMSYLDILNKIYEINGIERVRTVYSPLDGSGIIIRDGISFATWSGTYIDIGDDLEIGNTTRTLLDFQFPLLETNDIASRIKVIRKSINNINQIVY